MAGEAYQRLSGMDRSFLVFEDDATHMHISATIVLESDPVSREDGSIDIDRIRRYVASRLHRIPRFRQRLAYTPIENHPVWVDDAHFNIQYHVRHTSLPRPGDDRQLKHLAARVMSQQLDRAKPLWEMWVVEGLEGGRFAIISKTHHCMVDGVGGVDLLAVLMSLDPSEVEEEPPTFLPRPVPSGFEMFRSELFRRVSSGLEVVRELRGALERPDRLIKEVGKRVQTVSDTLGIGMRSGSETPITLTRKVSRPLSQPSSPPASNAMRRTPGPSPSSRSTSSAPGSSSLRVQRPARWSRMVSSPGRLKSPLWSM